MFSYTTIKDYHKALQNGQTTCVEAVHSYVGAIRARTQLNAFLEVYEIEALERAAALDLLRISGAAMGKLSGVIIGLKDVISYKGHSLSAGSRTRSPTQTGSPGAAGTG